MFLLVEEETKTELYTRITFFTFFRSKKAYKRLGCLSLGSLFFFSVKTKINKQIINFFGSKLRRSLNQDINHSSVDLYQTVDILSHYFVQPFL